MKATISGCLGWPLIAWLFLFSGCKYYKQQTGYLITRSESFTHHYDGALCGIYGLVSCDLPEVRYTLIHRGVKTIAHCQAWDERSRCGGLIVGKAYDCKVDALFGNHGDALLDCKNNGVLGIESSALE